MSSISSPKNPCVTPSKAGLFNPMVRMMQYLPISAALRLNTVRFIQLFPSAVGL